MTKVQLTLTSEEANILSIKADLLGYGLTRFIKYLISNEANKALEADYPTFKMSPQAKKNALQARLDHQNGKTILLKNIDDLDSL